MKKIVLVSSILFTILSSCKSDVESVNSKVHKINETNGIEKIETLFDETKFNSNEEQNLLKELEICNPSQKDAANYNDPACLPKFFKFFKYNSKKSLKDAFLLLIKSKVQGFPLRRVLIFEREKGELVKVNGFVANLIEKRKSKSHYDDLVLRFNDHLGGGEIVFYNCLYRWKDKHYVFDKVEQINDANIKPMYQDSMNNEIYSILSSYQMEF